MAFEIIDLLDLPCNHLQKPYNQCVSDISFQYRFKITNI